MLAAGAAANAHAAGIVNLAQIGQSISTGAAARALATGQPLPGGTLPFAGSSAAGAAAAQQHALQSVRNLSNAAQVIAAQQAAQANAAALAAAAPSSVPNGLTTGGLQVLQGGTWMNASQPTQTTANGQTTVTIQQVASDGSAQGAANTGKAILDWKTFNVGRNTTVYFDQSGGTQPDGTNSWTVLNRVSDPLGVPSQILGSIKAQGQVLLIDHNGILFGGTSQINVHSLVASALGITNQQFLQGIVNQQTSSTTNQISPPQFVNDQATPAGDVTVEAGAQIQTAPSPSVTAGGGSVYLFGSNVTNNGTITTPNGQILLAAGSGVYLTQSGDPDVRGVTANVDNGGTATNTAQGMLYAPTGNVSMVGLNVDQAGIALASTSVDQAGTVTLFAQSGVQTLFWNPTTTTTAYYVVPVSEGLVTYEPGSVTAVLPDETGETALAGQPQGQSVIKAEGETIDVLGGASLLAPAGKVKLQATDNPLTMMQLDRGSVPGHQPQFQDDAARVYVAPGATIDVSGLQGVAEAAADDAVLVDVQSNELRDSPVQQGGLLTNQKIWVNIDPSELDDVASDQIYTAGGLLEISGWLGTIAQTLDQRLTRGGTVSIVSTGDVIMRPGASINIAGGTIDHQAGYVNQTLLLGSDGQVYTANNAPGDLTYTSVGLGFTDTHPRWGVTNTYVNGLMPTSVWQGEYIEGANAGALQVLANTAELDANVNASVFNGVTQRTPGSFAQAGALQIGGAVPGGATVMPLTVTIGDPYEIPDDVFAGADVTGSDNSVTDDTRERDPSTLLPADWIDQFHLSTGTLDNAGYGSITISAGQGEADPSGRGFLPSIDLAAGQTLSVATGGSITLNALGSVSVGGALVAHGGSVSITTALTAGSSNMGAVDVASTGSIDTSGLWTNDAASGLLGSDGAFTLAAYNGGNVSISAVAGVSLGAGSTIDASSGGWVEANGKVGMSNGLPVGTGGNISLITNNTLVAGSGATSSTVGAPTFAGALVLDGTIESYGFQHGGTLTLAAPSVQIGGAAPANATSNTGVIPGMQGVDTATSDPDSTQSTLWLSPKFFSDGGFGGYSVLTYGALNVMPGTDIDLAPANLIPAASALAMPTGGSVFTAATVGVLPLYDKAAPVNLTLSADDPNYGSLSFGAGARIDAAPGATVSLHAAEQMLVDGTIDAPAGTINLDLTDYIPRENIPTQTLWIGPDAQLLARGLVENSTDASGRPYDIALNGGTININQNAPGEGYYPSSTYPPGSNDGVGMTVLPVGTVVAAPGSVLDVSGAAGTESAVTAGTRLSSPVTSAEAVATQGGAINIGASSGMLWDGTLLGAGGSPTTNGGSLNVSQWGFAGGGYTPPSFELVLSQDDPAFPAGATAATGVPDSADPGGEMLIGANRIMAGNFADVTLNGLDALAFNGDVNLHATGSLTIASQNLTATSGANVTLSAPYVDIGSGQRASNFVATSGSLASNAAAPFAGTASLEVDGDLIDFNGNLTSGASYPNGATSVALPGFATMTFDSSGDIRFAPAASSTTATGLGALKTLGDLDFVSAQAYPVTSDAQTYTIAASGADSVITFARNSDTLPVAPLSAGGALDIIASDIEQGGVLRAPFGQLSFGDPANPSAVQTINLLPGSVTSVSGDNLLVPWGQPDGSLSYAYGLTVSVNNGAVVAVPMSVSAPVTKSISFYGGNLAVSGSASGKPAAQVDVSGGGDLYGAQFVSGSLGTNDTLNGVNTFAVLPSLGNSYAPRSPLMDTSNPSVSGAAPVNLQPGDQVYLSGVPGLPAGTYTLLPGHYALLPGAFKVTVDMAQTVQKPTTQQLPDGSYLVSGYRTVANTPYKDSLNSVFQVTPGNVVRKHSQYDETTVQAFFAAQAQTSDSVAPWLPADAGQMTIDVTQSLGWSGQSDFAPGSGGRGGETNIIGTDLAILGPGDTAPAGYVALDASDLDAIGAQSLLIGGTRTIGGSYYDSATSTSIQTPNALSITTSAGQILIGSHADITAPEVMVAATGAITVDSGARIDTTGYAPFADLFPTDPQTGLTLGNYALLNGGSLLVATNAPSALPVEFRNAAPGGLTLGAGSQIDALGNIVLAATGDLSVDDSAGFAAPSIGVTVQTINVGDAGGNNPGALNLTDSVLAALTSGDPSHGIAPTTNLTLNAQQSIDFYGSANLGTTDATGAPIVANLTLDTPVIQGFGAAGDTATLTAGNLTLEGGSTSVAATGAGQGSLALNATGLTLGAGDLSFGGFGQVALNASSQVVGSGAGAYQTSGDLTLSTPLVTAQSGANTSLQATGAVNFLAGAAGAAAAGEASSSGAHLSASGRTVNVATDIDLPSGTLALNGTNGVTLASGADLDVSGALTPFFDVVRIAPGGTINLNSSQGNVEMAAGATMNLAGGDLRTLEQTGMAIDTLDSDQGGNGGTLNVSAPVGTAQLNGTFDTSTPSGYAGAKALVSVANGDSGALLGAIGGFSGEQSLTLQNGSISAGNITASDIELSAMTGNVTVNGKLDASGATGGTIRLSAGQNLNVSGQLDAHATVAGNDGGNVFLGIDGLSGGTLTLANGTVIDVSGDGANGSQVWLRAPRTGSGIALVNDGATVNGAYQLGVEAVAVTDITSDPYVDANLAAANLAAQNYMNDYAGAIVTSLGTLAQNPAFNLMPGIEFRSSGDMTLIQNPTNRGDGIDLHAYRYDGEPMVLTLRAAGNLLINGSISDGFEAPPTSPDGTIYAVAPLAADGPSATIRLVSGANLASPDPDALMAASQLAPGTGNMDFNEVHNDGFGYPIASVVRTGTGDLEIAAAGNMTLDTPFGIYTAGEPSPEVAGFTDPQRQLIISLSNDYYGAPPSNYLGYSDSGQNYDNLYPDGLYPSYPYHGGTLTVNVQGDLTSATTRSPNNPGTVYSGDEPTMYWLWTMTTAPISQPPQGTWFVNFGTYYQLYDDYQYGPAPGANVDGPPSVDAFLGIGALGGGNVNLQVGGNMNHVNVSLPSTGRMPAGGTSLADAVVTGGGNLNMQVGGELSASTVLNGEGDVVIHAAQIGDPATPVSRLNLSLGDAQASVVSDNEMNLIIGDPTRIQLSVDPEYVSLKKEPPVGLLGNTTQIPLDYGAQLPYGQFTTYTDNTSISAYAGGGDIAIGGDYVPSRVSLSAAGGSLENEPGVVTPFLALPSTTAQVDLLASQSIEDIQFGMNGETGQYTNNYAPVYSLAPSIVTFNSQSNLTVAPTQIVQTGDPLSAHVYAVDGNIDNPIFMSTEQTAIRAGVDIVNPEFDIQNNNLTDVSVIQAGRDIVNPSVGTAFGVFSIRFEGPGDAMVEAGRDILVNNTSAAYLSTGLGIDSVGNADNSLLPRQGASISIMAGTGQNGPDLSAFESDYLNSAGPLQGGSAYLQQLEQWLASRGVASGQTLSAAAAYAALRALPADQQLLFVEKVYFAELKAGGQAEAAGLGAGGNGYDRAYRAIEALFPGSAPGGTTTGYQGDVSVYGQAAIRTEAGGDINMLVPGGNITLGFENDTPNLTGEKDTARPGLLTLRGGDINTFTDGSVVVAQSRAFTELGGDILMFSDNGDLNAGKGKVTSLVTSPPQFTIDAYGNVTESPVTPTTGAGIATLIGVPGVQPGDVDLYAPHGTIDAGEAGIRVSGNLSIAALHVLNTQNITVQGKQTGLPAVATVDTGALTAATAATSAISDMAQNLVKSTASGGSSRHWVISVQVEGFGEPADDNDRKKRKPAQVSYNPSSPVAILGVGAPGETQRAILTPKEQRELSGV